MKLTIGADPEVFVRDTKQFVSAHGLIPGTKAKPHRVPHGAVQVDGMALEFNIDPVQTEDQFVVSINRVLSTLQSMIPKELSIAPVPVADFPLDYMEQQPEEAKELGCEPDFNAWTEEENPRPDPHPTMRTAAGHIHVGWTQVDDPMSMEHLADCVALTKQLDYYVGIPSVLVDKDNTRRSMYGMAGAFRPKVYGLEYRVPSNFWLTSEHYTRMVYRQTCAAFKDIVKGERAERIYNNLAVTIINNNDFYFASDICRHMGWRV